MTWLLRPSILVIVSVVLAVSAAVLLFWPASADNRAVTLPVPTGDQEIVWLYSATSGAQWERFVSAVELAVARLPIRFEQHEPKVDKTSAFPLQTTTTPEVSVSLAGTHHRLRFRWYKITSDVKSQEWVRTLARRRPPPLAIIGGNSSDLAIELAHALDKEAVEGSAATTPLLLLTTATTDDEVDQATHSSAPLTSIYPERTFRFCFTNRRMASAMIDFIWSRAELRPDSEPVYLAFWQDDPYSIDLSARFLDALSIPALWGAGRDWAALAGFQLAGGYPLDLDRAAQGSFSVPAIPWSERMVYSVGPPDRPNRWEAMAANNIMQGKLKQHAEQKRPLLLLTPAAAQPARRFLRELARAAPSEARRFVVATGDGIPFNAIYRDREVSWPIQDLPFNLLFFCHRNPVDEKAGFVPDKAGEIDAHATARPSAGTEDLLLNLDITSTVVQAALDGDGWAAGTAPFRERIRQAEWSTEQGMVVFAQHQQPLFDSAGNRRSGTGEHIVFLRPIFAGEQVEPNAAIEVWSWEPASESPGYKQRAILRSGYGE
jgi:hypothetical protein